MNCTTADAATKIYKVVMPDGTIKYTDRPVAGAKLVDIGKRINSVPTLRPKGLDSKTSSIQQTNETRLQYSIDIISPSPEETIRSNEGKLSVRASLSPKQSGQFKLFINNELLKTSSSPNFELTGLDRGEYRLQVQFFSNSGKLLASSTPSTFYLHKSSILNRAN